MLESLNKTKASSMTIAESLQDAHRIQTTLDQVSRSLTFAKLIYLLQTLFQDHDTYKSKAGKVLQNYLAKEDTCQSEKVTRS